MDHRGVGLVEDALRGDPRRAQLFDDTHPNRERYRTWAAFTWARPHYFLKDENETRVDAENFSIAVVSFVLKFHTAVSSACILLSANLLDSSSNRSRTKTFNPSHSVGKQFFFPCMQMPSIILSWRVRAHSSGVPRFLSSSVMSNGSVLDGRSNKSAKPVVSREV
mmetsp:Transcript_3445/g.8877  ORF Transcript_3445/g.8877 Transcript_3445/m.8877 type:complete len:165 (-) Transcript_3445:1822-2316(-)